MTANEVGSLIASFREAASLARKAGFDGVEIHGANHYAVHQFFSPRANHRVDNWGGTLSKRMNFPLAVAQAVRDALGPKLIAGFRVTPFESEPDGYTLEDANCFVMNLPSWVSTTSPFRSMIIGRADLWERPVFMMVRSRRVMPRQRVQSRNLPAL
jgi:2,4-dienoyl-CoA reductase-like NADH-dependent reductase (Old Yellow Enzyme family)